MSLSQRPADSAAERARRTRPTRRRWVRRTLWTVLGLFSMLVVAVAVAFIVIDPPSPNAVAEAQTSIVYYADGETELARLSEYDRESVRLAEVPEHVQRAVLAAEDRGFYDNSGVSVSGIARSAWQAVSGSDTQGGGSTITQQFVKNYFLTQERTLDRKLREIVIAIKIDHNRSKDDILEGYLNTIYYGRGAYGIQTAAQAYFGKNAKDLDVAEGAVLASVINAPSLFDPALGEQQQANLQSRFTYVLDGMVTMGWLDESTRAGITMPAIQAQQPARALSGPEGYVIEAVRQELRDRLKLSDEQINAGGLRVTTTIDPQVQTAAVTAVQADFPTSALGESTENVYAGLAAVRPGDGAILALYGGRDYQQRQFSAATDARAQAGSTFKAFTLIAALQQGISTKTRFDGDSPFRDATLGPDFSVKNYGNASYGTVDLRRATAKSVNTAFVRLNLEIDPEATRAAAVAAGIPENTPGLSTDLTNVLGTASPRVLDLANAYATIAAEGQRATPYLVAAVDSNTIQIHYQTRPNVVDAFGRDVAADTIDALRQVTKAGGTANRATRLGRPSAGKTGTTDNELSYWFAGFTPQISAAVAIFKDVDGQQQPLTGLRGPNGERGSRIPVTMWVDFVRAALDGVEPQDFPDRAGIGDDRVRPVAPPPSKTSGTTTTTSPIPSETSQPSTTTAPPPPTTTADPAPTTPAPTDDGAPTPDPTTSTPTTAPVTETPTASTSAPP